MITGDQRKQQENSGFAKKIGISCYEVLGVNMTNKQLKEAGFYVKDEDLDSEREFTGEDNGMRSVRLEFALKQVKTENPHMKKISFFLKDGDRENEKTGNIQWINDQGKCTWGSKASLPDWFKGTDGNLNARKAKDGEEHFMNFMRACMNIDWKNGGVLKYDLNKMFNGNFKEIQGDLKTDYLQTVIVANTIKVKDVKNPESDEMETKEFESFYSKMFAPGVNMKFLNNKKEFTDEDIKAIRKKIENNKGKKGKDRDFVYAIEELVANMADPEYGCKDIFYPGLLKNFDASESFMSSAKVVDTGSADF